MKFYQPLILGFSTPSMSSTSSIPESAGITPLRGISLESVVSGQESTVATPSGGVSLDTPGSKTGGKDVRVSLRGTKRTKSDDTVTKTGSEARQTKRSKSESSSAQKKVSVNLCLVHPAGAVYLVLCSQTSLWVLFLNGCPSLALSGPARLMCTSPSPEHYIQSGQTASEELRLCKF